VCEGEGQSERETDICSASLARGLVITTIIAAFYHPCCSVLQYVAAC